MISRDTYTVCRRFGCDSACSEDELHDNVLKWQICLAKQELKVQSTLLKWR